MCPHTTRKSQACVCNCVSRRTTMCPHTTIFLPSCYYVCALILLGNLRPMFVTACVCDCLCVRAVEFVAYLSAVPVEYAHQEPQLHVYLHTALNFACVNACICMSRSRARTRAHTHSHTHTHTHTHTGGRVCRQDSEGERL